MEDNKSAAEVVDRKEGYYWVRTWDKWTIAEYHFINGSGYWIEFNGAEGSWSDDNDFFEIDERQICRS